MTIQTVGQLYNPITGVFGTGNVQFFTSSGTWTVPQGIGKVRVRLWGAGGPWGNNSACYGGGGGGGFALKTIYDLTGVTSVAVTVGSSATYVTTTTAGTGGTSSFGSYCSATGGSSPASSPSAVNGVGGTGIGGDINTSGGYAYNNTSSGNGGGGGCGSIFGNGGNNQQGANNPGPSTGGAGAGHGASSPSISYLGGTGFFTAGGLYNSSTNYVVLLPQISAVTGSFPLDFIGTGGGGAYYQNGANGGGGAYAASGGFPGGGPGYGNSNASSGAGLVIVEW